MTITRFEALGLLPDEDQYVGYAGAHEKKLRRFSVDLEQVMRMLPDDDDGRIGFNLVLRPSQPRLGWMVRVAGVTRNSSRYMFYLKTDKKKIDRMFGPPRKPKKKRKAAEKHAS